MTALLITTTRWAFGARRQEFVPRQLAVAILVEGLQRCWGVCHLAGIDHAIVVGVERLDNGQRRWTMMFSLWTTTGASLLIGTRSTLSVALLTTRRAVRPGRPEFVRGQPAIAVLIERLQGDGGVRNLGGIDHAIVVGVEGLHNR